MALEAGLLLGCPRPQGLLAQGGAQAAALRSPAAPLWTRAGSEVFSGKLQLTPCRGEGPAEAWSPRRRTLRPGRISSSFPRRRTGRGSALGQSSGDLALPAVPFRPSNPQRSHLPHQTNVPAPAPGPGPETALPKAVSDQSPSGPSSSSRGGHEARAAARAVEGAPLLRRHLVVGAPCAALTAATASGTGVLGMTAWFAPDGFAAELDTAATPAMGAGDASGALRAYQDPVNGFSLLVPASWEQKEKAGAVALFEDPERRSINAGVVVLPVRIASLAAFGSLDFVADRLLQAERKKESTKTVDLLKQEQVEKGAEGNLYYEFEYSLDSTRGNKRILASVTISQNKLFILNVAAPESAIQSRKDEDSSLLEHLEEVVKSFSVL